MRAKTVLGAIVVPRSVHLASEIASFVNADETYCGLSGDESLRPGEVENH